MSHHSVSPVRGQHTASPMAAIYLRVSSALQEDNYSLDTQEARCREYCAQQGYVITDELVLRDVHSGAELWERAGLSRLREHIRAGTVQVVVAFAIDRLSRKQHHLGLLLSEAERYGVALEFATETLDDSPAGKFLHNALAFVADMEREKFRERSQRGKQARVQSGKPLHGQRPLYGYRWNEDKSGYEVNEVEAQVVRRIFHDMANGHTLRSITQSLSAEGIPVPLVKRSRSNLWDMSTVQRICRQPAYWGEAVAYRYRLVRKTVRDPFTGEVRSSKTREMRSPAEHVSVARYVPALVDKGLADIVNARLEQNRAEAARHNKNPEATLLRGGFVKCGYCGNNFIVSSRSGRYGGPAYRCGSKMHHVSDCGWHMINARVLDQAVWQQVRKLLTQPEIIAQELERQRTDDPAKVDLETIEHRLHDISRQQTNLTRLAAQLPESDQLEPLVAQLKSLKDAQVALEREREQVIQRHEAWELSQQRLDNLYRWCSAVSETIDGWSYQQKREALYALGVRVQVFKRDHTPRYTVEANIPVDAAGPIIYSTRTD